MTTTTTDFLADLRERGIRVWVEDGHLKCDAPPGTLDDDLRAQLTARKQDLLTVIAAAEATLGGPRSLVPLKPTGDFPPLFARPGHNGDIFCYRPLANHLHPQQPLYGVEPRGLDGSPAAETVEEMAAYEVAQIRGFQAVGPYYIAGFCAGGTIAFESARQLAQAGEEVSRVMLFGSPFPTTYRTGRAQNYLRWQGQRARRHAARATAGSLPEGFEYIRSRTGARVAQASGGQDPVLANQRRIEKATMAAVRRYEPPFYAGRVDVFLPNEAWRHSADRPAEWKRVAGQVVEHVGPDECDGDSMLLEPHVRILAALLDGALHDERRQHAI